MALFRLVDKKLRHSWQKDCSAEEAAAHAKQVARELARDECYEETSIAVTDESGKDIATVPVPKR